MSASQRRFGRVLTGLASAAAVVAVFGFGLMSGPAQATGSNGGSVDTSATTVESQASALTRSGGDNKCDGNICKRVNWCPPGDHGDHVPKVLKSDAPVVHFGNKGDKGGYTTPPCIKKPDIDWKCCVDKKDNSVDVVVKVTNPNNKGGYKVRIGLDGKDSQEKWVEPGETVEFIFDNAGNGNHTINTAVWLGKGSDWCTFKPCPIVVKCKVPTSPPTTPPTTVPTTAPTTTPPTSNSPSTSPSASTSTSPAPGGGGGNNEPQLPVTGPVATTLAFSAGGLLLGGLVLFALARRRQTRFTA